MNHKQYVPPLGHATPDPLRQTVEKHHKSSSTRPPTWKPSGRSIPVEEMVLAVVWGAVAGLVAFAWLNDRRQVPPPTWRDRAVKRVREWI